MALTIDEVRSIAYLARLHLTEEELNRYAGQLSSILEYAARLQEVDTSHISPTSYVLPITTPLRKDTVRPSTPREKILSNAAEKVDGMFYVPPVLDTEP